jgi:hypothetical protein
MINFDKIFDIKSNCKLNKNDLQLFKEYLDKKSGWVYISKSKDNSYLKIGRTGKNPLERAKTLSSTGVLNDYEVFFALKVFNQYLVEKKVHQRLKKFNVKKEFFSLNENIAIKTIEEEYNLEENILSEYFDLDLLRSDLNLIEQSFKN